MNGNLSEAALWRLGRALSPYSTAEPLAVATELGIRNEALLRWAVDMQVGLGSKITGWETTAIRRRRREVAEAAQFRAGSQTRRDTTKPVVNWHEGGSGPALLLLNGWTASGLVWPQRWLRRLEERYRVIRIDNRGTGWSRSAPSPFTIGDLANDTRTVLQACGIEHATVLGLSMGGMIAQELAVRDPAVVDSLILVGTRPPTPAQIPSHDETFLALMRTPPSGSDLRAYFIATWSQTMGDECATQHPDVVAEVADQLLRRVTPRSGVLTQARAMWSWHGASRLRRIGAPTTIVHGNRDPLIPVGNGMRLARLIPSATYVELPGVGHLVPHEAGDALLRVLDSHSLPT